MEEGLSKLQCAEPEDITRQAENALDEIDEHLLTAFNALVLATVEAQKLKKKLDTYNKLHII